LNLDVANGKGGVWGGIFHLLRCFLLANFGRAKWRDVLSLISSDVLLLMWVWITYLYYSISQSSSKYLLPTPIYYDCPKYQKISQEKGHFAR